MKKFLILGNKNAITYKEFFPYFKKGEVCTGYEGIGEFFQPDGTLSKNMKGLCRWFSNLIIFKETELKEGCKYDPDKYLKYDNYDAINVDKLKELPLDYNGPMGVPITIIDRLSSDGLIHLNYEYEIKALSSSNRENAGDLIKDNSTTTRAIIDGEYKYPRILIQKADYSIIDSNDIKTNDKVPYKESGLVKDKDSAINGKPKYVRVIIERV